MFFHILLLIILAAEQPVKEVKGLFSPDIIRRTPLKAQ
jgi:hypothetical protein